MLGLRSLLQARRLQTMTHNLPVFKVAHYWISRQGPLFLGKKRPSKFAFLQLGAHILTLSIPCFPKLAPRRTCGKHTRSYECVAKACHPRTFAPLPVFSCNTMVADDLSTADTEQLSGDVNASMLYQMYSGASMYLGDASMYLGNVTMDVANFTLNRTLEWSSSVAQLSLSMREPVVDTGQKTLLVLGAVLKAICIVLLVAVVCFVLLVIVLMLTRSQRGMSWVVF